MNPTALFLPECLGRITVVLARTSHPANIGAAARAMKTMGLSRLTLVAPNLINTPMTEQAPVFDAADAAAFRLPEESFVLASGAQDVLEQARVVATLAEALADTTFSCALTSRKRELAAPVATPRQLMPQVLAAAKAGQQVALVFGNETSGLSIDEVQLCNQLMTINGNPVYFSLNLAQAVQVVCYELFSHLDADLTHLQSERELASHQQISGMLAHMQQVMTEVGFFERRPADRLMRRMQRLFGRAEVEVEEIDILRGWFRTVQNKLPPSTDSSV